MRAGGGACPRTTTCLASGDIWWVGDLRGLELVIYKNGYDDEENRRER